VADNELNKEELQSTDDTTTEADNNVAEAGTETETETDDTYVSQFGELTDTSEDVTDKNVAAAVETEVKKKSKAAPIIITVIIVLILAALGIGAYFMFSSPSIIGSWKYEQGDTVVYYTFTDTKISIQAGDNIAQRTASYDYKMKNDGNKKSFDILISDQVAATYNYEVTGNDISGKNLKLTVDTGTDATDATTASEDSTNTMKFTGIKSVDLGAIKTMDDYKTDDKLVGEWKNVDVGFSYIFGDDGVIQTISTSAGESVFKCGYSVEGTTITAVVSEEQDPTKFDFTYDGDNKIVISGTTFVRTDSKGEPLEALPESSAITDDTLTGDDTAPTSAGDESSDQAEADNETVSATAAE